MRSTVLIFHSFLHLTSLTSPPRAEPSFECSGAERPDERVICNDDDLSQRDQLGSQIFAMLARKPDTADAGIEESRRFIDARRACGSEIDCIRREQNALLLALVRIAAPGSRPIAPPIEPVVSPWWEPFGRFIGPMVAVMLCVAFGWFTLAKIAASRRGKKADASADQTTPQVSEQLHEIESTPDKSFSSSDKSFDRRAASTSTDLGWLAGIATLWRRYKTNASAKRAISEIRREERRPTRFRQGKLFDAYGVFLSQCTICDRSVGGARVRVDKPLQPLKVVRFVDDVEKIIVEANVAWQRGNELGLAFRAAAKSVGLTVVRAEVRGSR